VSAIENRAEQMTPDIHFQGRQIDPTRVDLAEEFCRDPLGPHGPELQELLWIFRTQDQGGRYVLLRAADRAGWTVARVAERGQPPRVILDRLFETKEDAEWAVFALRWREHTGNPLELGEGAPCSG
jgi:hypothetical protein